MNALKTLSKQKLLIITFLGCAFSLVLVFYVSLKSPIFIGWASLTANTGAFYEQEKINYGLPIRLKIPKINVDAPVQYVGLTLGGAMDVPKGPADVAWFNLGQRPGNNGSAVIAGHSGWKIGKAVFDDLYKLSKGDIVYVEDDKGVIISFVVREIRTYNPKANASDVFGSNDGASHLNLVTCTGIWDKIKKSRSNRLVVFTDKVN